MARAIIGPMVRAGALCLINTGAIVEHECELEAGCHLAPAAVLCGAARLGEGVLVGAGAVVAPGLRVGAGAVLGAGAACIRDVPPGAAVAGTPARPLPER